MDACGRMVSPTLIGPDGPPPVCEGIRVWRFRYTACDMTTFIDWLYTYTVDYNGGLTPPANGEFTVSCPDYATDPGSPGPIEDACGRLVFPYRWGRMHQHQNVKDKWYGDIVTLRVI
jgi:hypothetical protein